jgi:hypothetical protein
VKRCAGLEAESGTLFIVCSYKRYFRYMYQLPDPHFSDGSFSAVSKPIFATKYSFSAFFEIYKIHKPL